MHPTKDIIGVKSTKLKDKRIGLCMTGSVACIRSVDIARELMRNGAEVYPFMTEHACELVTPMMMEWATGNKPITKITGEIEHVELGGAYDTKLDYILVAPATANTISKIVHGITDSPVLALITAAFGNAIPITLVPAMHGSMFKNKIIRNNLQELSKMGFSVLYSKTEEGKLKIASSKDILEEAFRKVTKPDAENINFLVNAGPTREYIDDMRFISNLSSGKMGIELAKELARRSGNVFFVHGPVQEELPTNTNNFQVETSQEMLRVIENIITENMIDYFIGAAAVSDWLPQERYEGKISSQDSFKLRLNPAPKIIDRIKELSPETILTIFKAEIQPDEKKLVNAALERLKQAEADFVVANDVSKRDTGFASDKNEIIMLNADGEVVVSEKKIKSDLAQDIVDSLLKKKR